LFLFFGGAELGHEFTCDPARAAEKQKQEKERGTAGAINRPPLRGFRKPAIKESYAGLEQLWVMTRPEGCAPMPRWQ
jgi:hypothetical protein